MKLKDRMAFWLCLAAICGLLIFGVLENIDVSNVIAAIVGMFIGGKAAQNSLLAGHAARDPNADTVSAIEKLEK